MPIEIKELVIRAVVSGGHDGAAPALRDDAPAAAGHATGASTEDIVQECVRQVMRILSKERER
jgi:hypothetical protein